MAKLPVRKTSVDAFLQEASTHAVSERVQHRLIFALDATASREHTWDMATSLHGELFSVAKAEELAVQLVYYRGFSEFYASPWTSTASDLLTRMQSVRCMGGATQIVRLLAHIRKEATQAKTKAAVFIGDACEESAPEIFSYAGQLGLFGVPVFVFQEGSDPMASHVFSGIAARSGGAHIPFRPGSSDELRQLLGAVATFATQGADAVKKIRGSMASRLLTQLKR